MTHPAIVVSSLTLVVLVCWVGALGAWRMREPTQALHYLSLPSTLASVLLAEAVFVETGWSPAAAKSVLICVILIVTNSVVTHATARAIRVRKLGNWEPRKEDGVDFDPEERKA